MEKLTLHGKTLKGRNRVRELGTEWLVILYRDSVSFSPHRLPGGGWLCVAPIQDTEKTRWIMRVDDPDFVIEKTEQVS